MLSENSKILLADDIPSVVETVQNILNVLGFNNFLIASNGEEAWEVLNKNPDVELVISDWKMPRLSGLDLLKRIKRDKRFSDLPFIFLTSKSENEDIALACDYGVTTYIVKPVNIAALDEKIKDLKKEISQKDSISDLKEVERLLELSNIKDAEQKLQTIEDSAIQGMPRFRQAMAKVLFYKGEFNKAETEVDLALEGNSKMAKAWMLKAELRLRQQDLDQALECVDKALEVSPNNADYHLQKGKILIQMDKYDASRMCMQRALNIQPKDKEIKEKIWNSYLEYGMAELVERDFGHFLFNSLGVETLNRQGLEYRKQGKFKQAIQLYQKALNLHPENPYLLYNKAIAHASRKEKDKAAKDLQRALIQKSDFSQARELLKKVSGND